MSSTFPSRWTWLRFCPCLNAGVLGIPDVQDGWVLLRSSTAEPRLELPNHLGSSDKVSAAWTGPAGMRPRGSRASPLGTTSMLAAPLARRGADDPVERACKCSLVTETRMAGNVGQR